MSGHDVFAWIVLIIDSGELSQAMSSELVHSPPTTPIAPRDSRPKPATYKVGTTERSVSWLTRSCRVCS